jgi:uncharacterized membrane protein YfcA
MKERPKLAAAAEACAAVLLVVYFVSSLPIPRDSAIGHRLYIDRMPGLGTYALLCVSALAAGIINAVAGGGTLLTFSALLTIVDPVVANATSTVALVPGSIAGAWGYRREMRESGRWLKLLIWPSLIGGGVGTLLVTRLEAKYFAALVPWLILGASILFLVQPAIGRLAGLGKSQAPPSAATLAGLIVFQFLVAVYGGYFGAGIGILMLSSLAMMGLSDIHQMNAVKTFLAACINCVAVAIFALEQKIAWQYALIMAGAAIIGGYLGAHTARRMNRNFVRWLVILIGFGLAAYYFYERITTSNDAGGMAASLGTDHFAS